MSPATTLCSSRLSADSFRPGERRSGHPEQAAFVVNISERLVEPRREDFAWARSAVPVAVLLDDHMGYHMVMARREVLVQLDDDLVEQLDALAVGLGTNRSELMRRGAQAVLDAEGLAAADRQLRSAYERQPADPRLV